MLRSESSKPGSLPRTSSWRIATTFVKPGHDLSGPHCYCWLKPWHMHRQSSLDSQHSKHTYLHGQINTRYILPISPSGSAHLQVSCSFRSSKVTEELGRTTSGLSLECAKPDQFELDFLLRPTWSRRRPFYNSAHYNSHITDQLSRSLRTSSPRVYGVDFSCSPIKHPLTLLPNIESFAQLHFGFMVITSPELH